MRFEPQAPNAVMQSIGSPQILRSPEVIRRTGRSRTTLWRDVRDGRFPAPVQLGPNAVGWYEHEVSGWLADRQRVNYAGATMAYGLK